MNIRLGTLTVDEETRRIIGERCEGCEGLASRELVRGFVRGFVEAQLEEMVREARAKAREAWLRENPVEPAHTVARSGGGHVSGGAS